VSAPSDVQSLVGRALLDGGFRKSLTGDVRGTLKAEGYRFDEDTVAAIERAVGDRATVDGFGKQFKSEFLSRLDYAI
jgi:hypothetical protein